MPLDQSLRITRAEAKDLPALLALYGQLNSDDPELDPDTARIKLESLNAIPGSGIFVGFVGSELVSTVTLVVIPNMTRGGRSYGLIENVVTGNRHRQRGYGGAIMQTAVDQAWQHDCYKVMLLTGSCDAATHRFYEQCGFSQNKTGYQIRNGILANKRLER